MGKSIETILMEVCEKGDVTSLKLLGERNINLKNKSRSKGFNTLFDRAVSTALSSKKNTKNVIAALCEISGEGIAELLSEDMVVSIANKYQFDVLDCFIEYGFSFSKESKDKRYLSIYDRLFRESISYARIELLEYLIPRMDINILNLNKVVHLLVRSENILELIESKLQERIDGFTCIYALLCEKGLTPMAVAEILEGQE